LKVFISHKNTDDYIARSIYTELRKYAVDAYLDSMDNLITEDGKALTDHIKNSLAQCTDILVVMSKNTAYSQWVPFEVGMSAQVNMPTVTFLAEETQIPSYLLYWPRLNRISQIGTYVVERKASDNRFFAFNERRSEPQVSEFYSRLKASLR